MLYLLGGFAVLSGFLLLIYLFVNADPARLARGLKVSGIVIAVLAVATLAVSGRLAALLMPLAMLMPLLIRVRSVLDRYRPPRGGQSSKVETPFLPMNLDHDTGTMEAPSCAAVRRHAPGRLAPADLLALALMPRGRAGGARLLGPISTASIRIGVTSSPGAHRRNGPRERQDDKRRHSIEEPTPSLVSRPAPTARDQEAHRRLMVRVHPDHVARLSRTTKIQPRHATCCCTAELVAEARLALLLRRAGETEGPAPKAGGCGSPAAAYGLAPHPAPAYLAQ
jgi:hypothetical protein